jgi:drug/metabolite transporter (DMT)-like permease
MNWTVMKIGVRELPPIWFRLLGVALGTILLFLYAQLRSISLAVPRGSWMRLFVLALPNMIIWYLVAILAIAMLPSGRAAILGYTMPLWAALIGAIFLKERLPGRIWFGVGCAFLATGLLVSGEWETLSGRPLGVALMLFAACAWGAGTHLLRRLPIDLDTLALTFWMMAITSVVLLFASWFFERRDWILPTAVQWMPIFYNAVFVLGICNVVWFALARSLPPVASGLSGMLVPVVGVFSGMLLLGEAPLWRDFVALALILLALATVVLPARTPVAASEAA